MRHILKFAIAIGVINLAYYNLLDVLPAPEFTILMLGFVSLIVLPIGIYLGLRKISSERSAPLRLWESILFGMLITEGAGFTVIVLRIVTTAVSLSKYESLQDYFQAGGPESTLFWYSVFGLVYCVMIHVIIRLQYAKSNQS